MNDLNYIKVKNKNNLVRDTYSNGIVNTDFEGYNQYVENYKRNYNSQQKIKDLECSIDELKSDLNDIKNLLKSLVNQK